MRVVYKSLLYALGMSALSMPAQAEQYFVKTKEEYFDVHKKFVAGDVVVLANGEWRDFEILFRGEGTREKPITLKSQDAGKVIITGRSNLRIGGKHMIVSGLVFRDGSSPTGEVISFRRSKDDLAYDSRVTQVVIDHFSQLDRQDGDYWVALYGKRNRFDHNHLVGKTNNGVTLAVRLDSEESRENGHRIDHNYFGPRPVFGSNGGETVRVGTSHYSMFDSGTVIENNIFDRTDGEIEIISIKSGGNIVRGNLFLESSGALTLRHGDGNLVERNVFLGNGKDHSGGIRVINKDQVVRNNYLQGLRGTGFASALTIMNGVPNSPVNRYVQVSGAVIENNSILDSVRVTLGAGSDEERSAVPVDSRFTNNLVILDENTGNLDVVDDMSGIAFAGNKIFAPNEASRIAGVAKGSPSLEKAQNGLLYPADPSFAKTGAPRDLEVLSADKVGVAWYPKPARGNRFGTGEDIHVGPGDGALANAFAVAKDGDRIILSPGEYQVDRTLVVTKSVTIEGDGQEKAKPTISFTRSSLFEMATGGNLQLRGIRIDGVNAPDAVGNAVIRTSAVPIQGNIVIEIDGVDVYDLNVNRSFDFVSLGKNSMADQLNIANSNFHNVSGKIISADTETDDYGRYNIEYLTINNSDFTDIAGPVVSLYRGGSDESTFGPHFQFKNNNVNSSGVKAGEPSSLLLHGVQQILIENSNFTASAPIRIRQTTGVPVSEISNSRFLDTPAPVVTELKAKGTPRVIMEGNVFAAGAQ